MTKTRIVEKGQDYLDRNLKGIGLSRKEDLYSQERNCIPKGTG